MLEIRFEGIVIGYEDHGDVDRVVSFYTPHFGKIETVARGVRHEKSKLKGHLELATHGEFIIAQNRGRGVLTDAITLETFPALRSRPETVYLGAAIVEMYDAYLYPHATDGELWLVLLETLRELDMPHADFLQLQAVLDTFARRFLKHLGYLRETAPTVNVASPFTANACLYDSLLAHTDISGPTLAGIAHGLMQLAV